MRDDRPALISPSPADLPLLFEAGRLLVRHASLEEAMSPLLAFLADRADLAGGIAALALSDDADVRVTAVSDASDRLHSRREHLPHGFEILVESIPIHSRQFFPRVFFEFTEAVDGTGVVSAQGACIWKYASDAAFE